MPEENFNPAKYNRLDQLAAGTGGSQPTEVPDLSQPKKQGRFLGGALPLIGGIGGGLIGSLPSGGIPTPLSILGAGGGTAAGFAVENLAEDLLNRQQQTPQQQLTEAGTQTALSATSEAVAGPLLKLGGKILAPLQRVFGKKLPELLVKTALPEAGEAGEIAVKRSISGTGKELQEEVVERGIMGKAKTIAAKAKHELSGMPGTIESQVQSALGKIPTKPIQAGRELITNTKNFLYESIEETRNNVIKEGGITKVSQIDAIGKELQDILALQLKNVTSGGWKAILKLRRSADKLGKGMATVDVSSITKKVNAELANVIRNKLSSDPEILRYASELPELINAENFFIRLYDAASSKAAGAWITRGDIIPLVIGGGVGAVTGGLPGAMLGVAAAKAPFTTPVGTAAAQGLKRGTQAAGTGLKYGTKSLMQMLAPYGTGLLKQNSQK